ncbi:MAG: hypothetical protein HQ591_09460 [candidate division Zixibacteria bacterium]|nr:hypothetical protein [Candidatus Tariuqbacter arcticus]
MFIPNCLATAVGSFPHLNVKDAVERVFESVPFIPAWPQLPKRNIRENMYTQFSSGMPCFKIDEEEERVYFHIDDSFESQLEEFYTAIIEDDLDYFAITEEYAAGLHHFLNHPFPEEALFVKGQLTGPISFGLTVTDQGRRSVIYRPDIFEVVVKTLVMKARWQVRQLKKLCDKVMLFIDEPYLSGFGSAFINITYEEVVQHLSEVIEAAQSEGAMVGLHCCGNTDWSMVMETPVDILNFDAYEYSKGMTLYPVELKKFLEKKGILAWGIVPSATGLGTTKELHKILIERIDKIASRGIDKRLMLEQCLLTSSCGMGSQTVEKADRVMELLWSLSRVMRGEYFTGGVNYV